MFVAGHIYWITFGFINPPHEKISLCFCAEQPLFFWVNSLPKRHGVAQLPIERAICPTLNYDSILDLSGAKTGSVRDLATARDAGTMSNEMKLKVLAELETPIQLLPDAHRLLALQNLA